jgi:diphthamide biosynthesis methyltransferase
MAATTDVLLTLRQARDRRMAKAKLIEVIVAREGVANREATIQAVERMIQFQLEKGRMTIETKNGIEFLQATL